MKKFCELSASIGRFTVTTLRASIESYRPLKYRHGWQNQRSHFDPGSWGWRAVIERIVWTTEVKRVKTISRDVVYEQVWSKLVTNVAADFGVTGTALKKTCDRNQIPTPKRAYWAKLEYGKRGQQGSTTVTERTKLGCGQDFRSRRAAPGSVGPQSQRKR